MKSIIWFRKSNFLLALIIIVSIGACRKSKVEPEIAPPPAPVNLGQNTKQTPTTDRTQLTNDSLFLYAQQVYFWNDALPSYDNFVPRSYGSDLNGELFAITRFKIDPATNKPYEYRTSNPAIPKYSYIQDIANRNPVGAVPNEQADVDLEGNGNDVGIFAIKPVGISLTAYRLYILAVDKGSPADDLGLTRGAYITKINNTTIGVTANFSGIDIPLINSTIYGDPNSIDLEGIKTDGTTFKATLNKKSYKSNPIFKTNVLTVGSKKIGYLAYARFSNESNSFAVLESAFNEFSLQGVTDLVIDLRYNGGGYISTAEELINLIAPTSVTGVMYKEYYNSTMQNGQATILKNQPLLDANDRVQFQNGKMLNYFDNINYTLAGNTHSFNKKGSLNSINNVIFIVSGNTASASELVINSLKPKMNVKLVGVQTYGKPVGFFPIRIQNKYDVFFSMFETRNSLDEGGYYSGMAPDVINEKDLGDYDFGNPAEGLLATAINVLVPKAPAVGVASRNKVMSVSADGYGVGTKSIIGEFKQNKEFVGMIETRHRNK